MWALLNFEISRDIEEVELSPGRYEVLPKRGGQQIKIVAYDTVKKRISEVEYTITGGTITERDPKWGEAHAVQQMFGETSDDSKQKISKLEAFVKDYRRTNAALKGQIEKLETALAAIKKKGLNLDRQDKDLLGAAVDFYRNYLWFARQSSTYVEMGRLYTMITGSEPLAPDEEKQVLMEEIEQMEEEIEF